MKKEILKQLKHQPDYVSGEALSQSLGVSRAAISKQVKTLRALGYPIDAQTNRGYHLGHYDLINQLELDLLVEEGDYPLRAEFHETIDSTNRAAKQSETETIIVALEQTKGRGRRGRDWISQRGQGLYFSLSLTPALPPQSISAITQLAGLCVARAIGEQALIKWPNDVFIGSYKVCGILTELITQSDYVEKLIIGIGLNFQPVSSMDTATSLAEQGIQLTMLQFLDRFLVEFYQVYPRFLETPTLQSWLEEINQRSLLQGRLVRAVGSDIEGVFIGIDADGQAVVQGRDIHHLSYGEISLRGVDETT